MKLFLVVVYNLIILGGTVYLVQHGWSVWWFALAIMLLGSDGGAK
jgi:hypothetical protein